MNPSSVENIDGYFWWCQCSPTQRTSFFFHRKNWLLLYKMRKYIYQREGFSIADEIHYHSVQLTWNWENNVIYLLMVDRNQHRSSQKCPTSQKKTWWWSFQKNRGVTEKPADQKNSLNRDGAFPNLNAIFKFLVDNMMRIGAAAHFWEAICFTVLGRIDMQNRYMMGLGRQSFDVELPWVKCWRI